MALARSTMQPRLSSIVLLGLAGEDDVGAGEADAEARVGRALDEQAAALGAVGEGLADRAVDPLALRALALEDRDDAAEHRLADAVLGAALDPDRDAVGVEGAEALAGDRAAVEARGSASTSSLASGAVLVDPRAGERAGELGAEHAVVGVGRRAGTRCGPCAPAQTSPASAAISAEACLASIRIGRATTRPASARASTSSSATGRSIGSRSRNSSSGVISGARSSLSWRGDLLEQVVAADQVLGALVAERGDDLLDLLAHRLEEAGAALGGDRRPPAG